MIVFKQFIISGLEFLLQRHVLAHPTPEIYLLPLHNKQLILNLYPQGYERPACLMQFMFFAKSSAPHSSNQILLQSGDMPADLSENYVRLDISGFDLYQLLNQNITLPYPNIQISGELRLLQHFKNLITHTGIDITQLLKLLTGNTFPHALNRSQKNLCQAAYNQCSNLIKDIQEYAHYEANYLPDELAFETLKKSIFELNQQTNNIESRINLITTENI